MNGPRLVLNVASHEMSFDYDTCAAIPPAAQVADVGVLVPGRAGKAVRLSALVGSAGMPARARHLHISSSDPSFAVSIPLAEAENALVVYALGDGPLPESKGGPFRLLVPGHADECVHVKQLARIELSDRPGRDTRPKDDAEHAKLHKKK
ncbi:MAG TPA: molybdopterin-dependent oxidoreductase [Planctomycetota bacterium]|jgi:2-dehydropantoate 2-reductase|nr:molybdopterin-dependent oxidoreductase [Planctomycetota bacterium]